MSCTVGPFGDRNVTDSAIVGLLESGLTLFPRFCLGAFVEHGYWGSQLQSLRVQKYESPSQTTKRRFSTSRFSCTPVRTQTMSSTSKSQQPSGFMTLPLTACSLEQLQTAEVSYTSSVASIRWHTCKSTLLVKAQSLFQMSSRF